MIFLITYIIISFVNVLSEGFIAPTLVMVTKVLCLPILTVFVWRNLSFKQYPFIFGAIFFSWLGDVFLLESAIPIRFMLGLSAFLIAHVMYIIQFIKEIGSSNYIKLFHKRLLAIIFIFWALILVYILPKSDDFSLPIIMYASVIMTMLYFAYIRYNLVENKSFLAVAIGATLFVLSDSMIAINKFVVPFSASRVLIMTTYWLAQLGIIYGLVRNLKKK